MSEDTQFLESETVHPETPFESRKYRVSYSCDQCGHTWKSRLLKVVPKKNPPCPNPSCAEITLLRQNAVELEKLKQMLLEQRGPAQIGGNPRVRNIDQAMDVVAKDFGLTDLNTSMREGDIAAPKLPPAQQKQADNFFGGGSGDGKMMVKDAMTGNYRPVASKRLKLAGARAAAGAYRNSAIAPIEVIPPSLRSKPPLKLVGYERIK